MAVWTTNSINVTFDANGGKIGGSDIQTVGGVPLDSLTAPAAAREGYTFDGWYTSPTVGTKQTELRFGYTDATYYAHWSASEITATLELNGGSIGGNQNDAALKGSYGTPIQYTVPTKAGNTFLGWKVKGTEDGTATLFPTYPAADTTYTAVWAASQITLTFNPMGGSFASSATGTRVGETGNIYTAPDDPTRTGYTFAGWYDKATDSGKVGNLNTFPEVSNTTYFAYWMPKNVTVTLNLNGGEIDSSTAAVSRSGSYGATVDYVIPERAGYAFTGWKLKGRKGRLHSAP